MWYCAHAIFYFELINDPQESFLVHENIYLISAPNVKAARIRAEKIACENEDLSEDGHLELNDKKARYVYAGIRKVVDIEPRPVTDDCLGFDGIEISYSVFEVDSHTHVKLLADGEMVNVLYRE